MKRSLPILFLLCLAACKPPIVPEPVVPPPPPSLPVPGISALVNTIPSGAEIVFDGQTIGPSPARLQVFSLNQLIDNLTAANMPDGAVEQRIKVITDKNVEVTLVFDRELSKMAKALNLSKILVFDYDAEITFDFNKSELKAGLLPLLKKQADLLKNYFDGIDIYICGHTDSIGRVERNQELSLDRALAVFNELIKDGIPRNRIKPQGFGSDFPLAENDTDEGRARNRRIEIILGR
jgi:outer membrane protein OmpA-like peptidoglycan-associated protein